MMGLRLKDLGNAELEVLRALWEIEGATVRQVLEHLQNKGRELAYTTVQTLLVRLEIKGYVTSNKKNLAFMYRPRVTRERVMRSRLRSLVDQLFDGRPTSLVVQLIEDDAFSADEIRQLQTHLDRVESNLGKADSE